MVHSAGDGRRITVTLENVTKSILGRQLKICDSCLRDPQNASLGRPGGVDKATLGRWNSEASSSLSLDAAAATRHGTPGYLQSRMGLRVLLSFIRRSLTNLLSLHGLSAPSHCPHPCHEREREREDALAVLRRSTVVQPSFNRADSGVFFLHPKVTWMQNTNIVATL